MALTNEIRDFSSLLNVGLYSKFPIGSPARLQKHMEIQLPKNPSEQIFAGLDIPFPLFIFPCALITSKSMQFELYYLMLCYLSPHFYVCVIWERNFVAFGHSELLNNAHIFLLPPVLMSCFMSRIPHSCVSMCL